MLKKVKSALLLTNIDSFKTSFETVAEDLNVTLKVEEEWCNKYRVSEDVIICGSKYIKDINEVYYENLVLILNPKENISEYTTKGINRFIFNFNNPVELSYALLYKEKTVVHASSEQLETILKDSSFTAFRYKDYDLNFDRNIFKYKGKEIYLCASQKRYLAEWLLRHNKDNSKRMILCNLRKKFGKDFLREIDIYGNPKEKNK